MRWYNPIQASAWAAMVSLLLALMDLPLGGRNAPCYDYASRNSNSCFSLS
jgi:hypothetical protein